MLELWALGDSGEGLWSCLGWDAPGRCELCCAGCAARSRAALTGCWRDPGAALDLAPALEQMEGGRCSSQAAWKAWERGRRWEKKL